MSAKVEPHPLGGWTGYCDECRVTISGHMKPVDLWADVHNDDYHREEE